MAGEFRGHTPIVIDEFNGLWRRDSASSNQDSTPIDHFSDCNNIQFIQSGFETRDGIDTYKAVPNATRIYTFVQETGESLLILDSSGNIFDSGSATPTTPILTIPGMQDFGYVSITGRAFLTPAVLRPDLPGSGKTGMKNEFIYVYEGDGTPARKAAGFGPVDAEGLLSAANSGTSGDVEEGIHIFGAVYETNTGFLTNIGPDTLPFVNAPGGKKVDLSNIPVSLSSIVTKVHIVATKAIDPTLYTGDTKGYEFFFIPGAIVNNGVTTLSVSFFDADLLDDASHLFDLFSEIPATVGLTTYHGRMIAYSTYNDISIIYVSQTGEPEAINQVDGLLIFPLDGHPVTNAQEFRDVLYGFKQTRTDAWSDNGDVPASWPLTILDQGIGCSLHGLGTVLDSGGVNIDFLIITDYSGIMLFNGAFIRPELSWKIQTLWLELDRSSFDEIQTLNDTVNQTLYIKLPDGTMLMGNYSNGLEPKAIRWTPWSFDVVVTSVALVETNKLILAA